MTDLKTAQTQPNDASTKSRGSLKRFAAAFAGLFIAVLVLGAIPFPVFTGPVQRTPVTVEFAHAAQVFHAIERYAEQHDGKYPLVFPICHTMP